MSNPTCKLAGPPAALTLGGAQHVALCVIVAIASMVTSLLGSSPAQTSVQWKQFESRSCWHLAALKGT
jgi:hypothetical protein